MKERVIHLREYKRDDLDAMYALDVECFAKSFRFTREAMRRFAEADNARVTLADEQGALLGFCILHVDVASHQAYIVTLDVAPNARRTGIASRLMACAEAHARVAGCCEVLLHVFTGNEGAIRFYERGGYERLGLTEFFYGRDAAGKGLDAWLYRRVLLPENAS